MGLSLIDIRESLGQRHEVWLERGQNYNQGLSTPRQIPDCSDLHALLSWLSEYEHSPNTFRVYGKEIRRLAFYCCEVLGRPISSMNKDDFSDYFRFLQDPWPRNQWIGPSRPWDHEDWRPLTGPLGDSSLYTTETILKSALSWLVSAGHLLSNPLDLRRNRQRKSKMAQSSEARQKREFPKETFDVMVNTIDRVSFGSRKPELRRARFRFLVHFLYELAPRLFEVTQSKVSDFQFLDGQWYWSTRGKGAKLAQLPVSEKLIAEFEDYREAVERDCMTTGRPASDYLYISLSGKNKAVTPTAVYQEVVGTMKHIAAFLSSEAGGSQSALAKSLSKVTTHWFRHLAITDFYEVSKDLRMTAEYARHSNIQTTVRYTHLSNKEMAAVMKRRSEARRVIATDQTPVEKQNGSSDLGQQNDDVLST